VSEPYPTIIRDALVNYFSLGELRTLCFDLGIDYEDLEGGGKQGKALALVQYARRHGRYSDLVNAVRQARPHLNLGAPAAGPATPPAEPQAIANQQQPQGGDTYIIQGDMISGDKLGGDKVGGDKINVGDISNSTGVAIGRDASAEVTTSQPAPEAGTTINIHGNVIGGVVGGGTVNAENIAGGDITIEAPQSLDEFKARLAELERLVQEAIAAGEIPDADDAETTIDDLERAEKEANKAEPRASRISQRLKAVKDILEDSTGVVTAAGKAATAVVKAAALANVLYQAVQNIF